MAELNLNNIPDEIFEDFDVVIADLTDLTFNVKTESAKALIRLSLDYLYDAQSLERSHWESEQKSIQRMKNNQLRKQKNDKTDE